LGSAIQWQRRDGGKGGSEDTEVAIYVTDAAEAGDDFLTDVAAFGGANGIGLETCFGREGIGSDVDAPKGKTAGDAERFPIG